MTVLIDLKDTLGIDEPIEVAETNANIRKVWNSEKEMTDLMIRQSEKNINIHKLRELKDRQEEYRSFLIDFIIDILKLNYKYKDIIMNEVSYFDCMNISTQIATKVLHIEAVSMEESDENKSFKRTLKERFFSLDNTIKDFDYNEQQVLTQLHISPGVFEAEDYYRMNEVLSAQSAEDRPMTGAGFLNQLNLNKDNANKALEGNKKRGDSK